MKTILAITKQAQKKKANNSVIAPLKKLHARFPVGANHNWKEVIDCNDLTDTAR